MLLRAISDLLKKEDWKWDFFINLSGSDYPIKYGANFFYHESLMHLPNNQTLNLITKTCFEYQAKCTVACIKY